MLSHSGGIVAEVRRIALYSHDAQGLGHLRRNLAIAEAVSRTPGRAVLLLTGAREAGVFPMPPGTDCLSLPALHKAEGRYAPRSLGLGLEEVIELRSDMIRAALTRFAPDLLIVDKHPLGVRGEMEPALRALGGRARVVLGLREVLDDPAAVDREWREEGTVASIRELYDAVWVYGDPHVYDPVTQYTGLGDVAAMVRQTGYIDRRRTVGLTSTSEADDMLIANLELPAGGLALCLVGGGEDGARLAVDFAHATLPPRTTGVIVTGPFMPAEDRQRLHRLAAENRRLRVVEFLEEPARLIELADSVVCMGGYNTVCELVARGKRTLIVPRVRPRTEQLIRARALERHGAVDVLHPENLSSQTVEEWLRREPEWTGAPEGAIDFGGLERVPALVDELARARPRRGPQPTARPLSSRHAPGVRAAMAPGTA